MEFLGAGLALEIPLLKYVGIMARAHYVHGIKKFTDIEGYNSVEGSLTLVIGDFFSYDKGGGGSSSGKKH